MFNMQEIGKKILSLRKSMNMTQVALADKLGITYQAVSSWERGNSMPDIEKIPEIASIFHITIDELIGDSKVVHAVLSPSSQEPERYENLEEDDIKAALPILKPQQIEEIIKSIDMSKIHDISIFLPFMCEADVREMAFMEFKNGKEIRDFLPFLHESDVKEIASQALRNGKNTRDYLPFMQESDVKEIASQAFRDGKNTRDYLPFMQESDVKEIASQALRNGKDIPEYLPFIGEADVKELASEALKKGKDIQYFLPFMGEEGIKRLMLAYLQK